MRRKAFVTGGSRGIGAGIVSVLGESGYDVAFTYHSHRDEAEEVQRIVSSSGAKSFIYQASLEEPDVPEAVSKKAVQDLGGVDLLVCCAGLTRHNTTAGLERELIDFVYGLNFRSYLLCSKVCANDMISRKNGGNIIFITSTRGESAHPDDSVYGGLKAALNRAAQTMALDLAPSGIRVNCVAPGATRVRGDSADAARGAFPARIPLGRLGTPREVGFLVRFVASDEASYMTGNTIKLDGGLTLPGLPENSEKIEI
ncbi:MAG: SDR family oxidoreductase [Clostridiales bacterium]|jgi:NAD(P)-dependent dehydrogenase (short-subunit alcohol dehydrogenase family)|nr:SDR family oxidoreductase [Clostridiales bacterium]